MSRGPSGTEGIPSGGESPERGAGERDFLDLGIPAAGEAGRTLACLEAFRQGDPRGFDGLWSRYRPALEVLIAGRIRAGLSPQLRSRLDAEAEDLLQEVALRVLAKIPEFEYRGPGSLLGWMSRVAEFVVQERVGYWNARRRDPRIERPLSAGDPTDGEGRWEPGPTIRSPGAGPSTAFDLTERRRRIAEALAELPDRQHTIVFWRFFAGAEWSEIATEVGAPSADAVRMECYLKVFPALSARLNRNEGPAA